MPLHPMKVTSIRNQYTNENSLICFVKKKLRHVFAYIKWTVKHYHFVNNITHEKPDKLFYTVFTKKGSLVYNKIVDLQYTTGIGFCLYKKQIDFRSTSWLKATHSKLISSRFIMYSDRKEVFLEISYNILSLIPLSKSMISFWLTSEESFLRFLKFR